MSSTEQHAQQLRDLTAERDQFRTSALHYAAQVAELNDQIAQLRADPAGWAPRVIRAAQWRPGEMEYAYRTAGDALTGVDELAGGDVRWSGGFPAWAAGSDPLVVRQRPTAEGRLTFEQSRAAAYRLLGDAADELRAGDWPDHPTGERREAVREALRLIGEAKDALNRTAGGV